MVPYLVVQDPIARESVAQDHLVASFAVKYHVEVDSAVKHLAVEDHVPEDFVVKDLAVKGLAVKSFAVKSRFVRQPVVRILAVAGLAVGVQADVKGGLGTSAAAC